MASSAIGMALVLAYVVFQKFSHQQNVNALRGQLNINDEESVERLQQAIEEQKSSEKTSIWLTYALAASIIYQSIFSKG